MKTLLFSFLAFLIAPAIAQAGLVGSLTGLDPSTYNEQWRVVPSNSYLILDHISGGSDLTYTEMVGFGTDSNGSYCDMHIGDSPGVTERIYLGDVHDISGVYVGAKSISATEIRCLWAYNFDDMSFLGEVTQSEPVAEAQQSCNETDGGFATYGVGIMTHNFTNISSPVTDFCVNDSQVNEYYCNSALLDGSHTAIADCDYGCLNGRCLYDYEVQPQEICEETDGGYAPYAVGTINHNFQNFASPSTDFCIDETRVNEYYCNSDLLDGLHTDEYDCPNGCLDGRCLYDYEVEAEEDNQPSPPPPQTPQPTQPSLCSDTDSGNDPSTTGTTSILLSNMPFSNMTDTCTNETTLVEYYCEESSSQSISSEEYECENGCVDGACAADDVEAEKTNPIKRLVIRLAELIKMPFEWLWNLLNGN